MGMLWRWQAKIEFMMGMYCDAISPLAERIKMRECRPEVAGRAVPSVVAVVKVEGASEASVRAGFLRVDLDI